MINEKNKLFEIYKRIERKKLLSHICSLITWFSFIPFHLSQSFNINNKIKHNKLNKDFLCFASYISAFSVTSSTGIYFDSVIFTAKTKPKEISVIIHLFNKKII